MAPADANHHGLPPRPGNNPSMFLFGQNQNGRSQGQRGEFGFRFPAPGPSSRPLLRSTRDRTPELLEGIDNGQERKTKFLSFDQMTDSDEAEMDLSENEESQPPRKKRATENGAVPAAPKWSNPDPYTSLPPPNETVGQTKKVDFVKLIRKAKVVAAAQAGPGPTNSVTANDDFISFGAFDDDDNPSQAPENAPSGPRAQLGSDPALGNRKRTYNDEIKGSAPIPTKPPGKLPPAHFNYNGSIISRWRVRNDVSGTPWFDAHSAYLPNVTSRLHKEVIDFYEWVKPRSFEHTIRSDLIDRLKYRFSEDYRGFDLQAFGSFAAGLYLPIGDMDLVLLSPGFLRSGRRHFGEQKKDIFKFAAYLRKSNIPQPGSVECIPSAKVPIIKFIDRITGLKVDLSFDNDTGLVANDTYLDWKAEYPAMPFVVSIIKQFLMIRGLNEVPTGGLGGFSTICLVTSLLQHLPAAKATNLGDILLAFFDFYGNCFDPSAVAISLNPPGFVNKRNFGVYQQNRANRLAIIDPNDRNNDVSKSTKENELIFDCFSRAHRELQEKISSSWYDAPGQSTKSILGTVIAGNYDAYEQQRDHLHAVYERIFGETDRRDVNPAPPGITAPGTTAASVFPPNTNLPPPPPPGDTSLQNLYTKKPSKKKPQQPVKGKQWVVTPQT